MDPYRLPTTIMPHRYELRLEPDLENRRFTGTVTVSLTVRERTRDLVLNAAELQVREAILESARGDAGAGAIEMDERLERCHIRAAEPLAAGEWRLRLAFDGLLNDKLRGFYRSTYRDEAGRQRVLAATQFEATDARRAFPCWDEPAFKAVFATTLAIDPALVAVSNTGIKAERREGGKKVVSFHDTIRMSTYLVAFIVGCLESTEPAFVGKVPVRIWCVPGKRDLASFGHRIAAFSLQFFQEYYGLPYPGDKLDLLAIPDFASGAMENLGAITFRETALLIDERRATHAELERVADVVAHENAHMWFGDLVTMGWWNGLWLNEAFATFMEMLAVDAWKPEWRRWATFGVSRAAALAIDALHSTRPIEYPVQAPHDADAMFDVLTYEKGAAVLRMLEQHLGPETFRAGVRDYIRAHAYGNADTRDLWAALDRAAGEPVSALMERWIFGEGYPLVTAEREPDGTLTLRQERFTYLPAAEGKVSAAERWKIPIRLRVTAGGRTESRSLLLNAEQVRVSLPDGVEAVLVNEGGHGFFHVRYAPDLLRPLLMRLPDGLAPIERFNVVNDAWAASLAGHLPLADFLDLTGHFRAERDRNVWAVLIGAFQYLDRVVDAEGRPRLETFVRDRVGPAAAAMGWTPRPDEDELARQLRSDLLRALGTLGNDPAVQGRALEAYERGARDPASVDPNVAAAVVAILARAGDDARYEEFRQRFRAATTPQEERRYLFALAAFQSGALLERTLASAVNGEIRSQDAPFVVSAVLQNVAGRERAWRFVTRHWDEMERLFPKQGLRRMCGGIVALATPELEREVRDFFDARKVDLGGKTLAQYLEQLRVAVTFRTRCLDELKRCLAPFGKT